MFYFFRRPTLLQIFRVYLNEKIFSSDVFRKNNLNNDGFVFCTMFLCLSILKLCCLQSYKIVCKGKIVSIFKFMFMLSHSNTIDYWVWCLNRNEVWLDSENLTMNDLITKI
jgi:hypothetical protein